MNVNNEVEEQEGDDEIPSLSRRIISDADEDTETNSMETQQQQLNERSSRAEQDEQNTTSTTSESEYSDDPGRKVASEIKRRGNDDSDENNSEGDQSNKEGEDTQEGIENGDGHGDGNDEELESEEGYDNEGVQSSKQGDNSQPQIDHRMNDESAQVPMVQQQPPPPPPALLSHQLYSIPQVPPSTYYPYGQYFPPIQQYPPVPPPPFFANVHYPQPMALDGYNPIHHYNAGSYNSAPVPQHGFSIANVYHEQAARMRDHAAAYASAAAGAAWAAAQIANVAAEFASSVGAAPYYDNLEGSGGPYIHNQPTFQPHPANFSPHLSTFPFASSLQHSSASMSTGGPNDGMNLENFSESFQNSHISNVKKKKHEKNQSSASGEEVEKEGNGKKMMKSFSSSKVNESPSEPNYRSRRKRQQRLFQDETSIPSEISRLTLQQQSGKVRRRLRSDGDSSTTSSGSSFMPNASLGQIPHRARTSYHNKKKARSDESLLGKTAVAALFEWCSKRQITPNFVLTQPTNEDFDCTVYLDDAEDTESITIDQLGLEEKQSNRSNRLHLPDGKELGKGRGRNKVVAKQEAARRALQSLLPGVLFDDETGILIELPQGSSTPAVGSRDRCTKNSLDDLAPNLAKQLAIGRDSTPEKSTSYVHQAKRTLDIYPGTSTTSEDEDENTYYTSRGASVCSVLLHAIIQIDNTRIPEGPTFIYHVAPSPLLPNQHSAQLRRKVSSGKPLPAVRATRGSFTCIARLKIRKGSPDPMVRIETTNADGGNEANVQDSPTEKGIMGETNSIVESLDESILEAVGTGSTKREARHIASAKLLALLFPECKTMVDVKAAAETMREQYAASKVLKHHSSMNSVESNNERNVDGSTENERTFATLSFSKPTDPPIPSEIDARFRSLLSSLSASNSLADDTYIDENLSSQSRMESQFLGDCDSSSMALRHLSRQKQLTFRVENALQMLNDRDEDGRSLPDELTADDVGRLILRRAEPDDIPSIKNFQFSSSIYRSHKSRSGSSNESSTKGKGCLSPRFDDSTAKFSEISLSNLCSQGSIVLLLCRAIAAFEDPPLGCAVLNLGFSMEHGSIIRLVKIASEKHLPTERFLDCLENFAVCMNCQFDATDLLRGQPLDFHLSYGQMKGVIESHVNVTLHDNDNTNINTTNTVDDENKQLSKSDSSSAGSVSRISDSVYKCSSSTSKLQSVQEESEVSDSSGNEKRQGKRVSKPSKRSRFT